MSGALLSIAILQVLTILVGLLRAKGLAVLLGPADFGVVSTIDQVVMTAAQLGALGLPFTGLKYMSHARSMGQQAFITTSASFAQLLTVVALGTTLIASAVFAWFPGIVGSDLVPYRGSLHAALLGIPAITLNILFVNTLAAAERPAHAARLNLLVALNVAAAAVIGSWIGGISGLYAAVVVAGVLGIVASAFYLRQSVRLRFSIGLQGLLRNLRTHPDIISSSGSVYLALGVYALSMLAIRAVVLTQLGATEAGLLQASLSIALTVGAILTPMNNLYLGPLVNQAIPRTQKVQAANRFASEMLVFLLLGALPVVLFPRTLLGMLFTTAFAPAAQTIALFVLWQCIYQIGYIYQQLLIGLDEMFYMAMATVLGYGGAALLSVVLVPRFGLAGVAWSLALGMLAYGSAAALRLGIRHRIWVPFRVVARSMYVGAIVLGASLLFSGRAEHSLVAVGARLGYALAALAALWASATPEERQHVRSMPTDLWGRMRARPGPSHGRGTSGGDINASPRSGSS